MNATETTTTAAAVAEPGAHVAPKEGAVPKAASRKKNAPKAKTNATETTTPATAVPDTGAHVAPKEAAAPKAASRKKGAPKAKKGAKKAKKPAAPHSKKAVVIEMLRAKGGATTAAIAKETGWQNHTIRGFMAGAMKKAGYKIESTKNDSGERCYRIVK